MSTTFADVLKEAADLHDRKGQDYGAQTDQYANVRSCAEFGVPPWLGAVMRANEKMNRLKTYAHRRKLANESVEDSMLDLAIYSLIALILFREEQANNN